MASGILGAGHSETANSILAQCVNTSDVVDTQTANHLHEALNCAHYLNEPRTPVDQLLEEVHQVTDSTELHLVLNSPSPLDVLSPRSELTDKLIQRFYGEHCCRKEAGNDSEDSNSTIDLTGGVDRPTQQQAYQMIQDCNALLRSVKDDAEILGAMSRVISISSNLVEIKFSAFESTHTSSGCLKNGGGFSLAEFYALMIYSRDAQYNSESTPGFIGSIISDWN